MKFGKTTPKWIQGFSDGGLLPFLSTTILDIASLYGYNFGTFGVKNIIQSQVYSLSILKGNIPVQETYDYYENPNQEYEEEIKDIKLTEKVKIKSLRSKEFNINGRIISGCLDVIENIIGTKYDNLNKFIEKYKEEGIVWVFDIYDINKENLIRKLWQLKYAGWFKHTKLIMFGRVNFYENRNDYKEAIEIGLKDLAVEILYDIDQGHTKERFIIINGSYATIELKNKIIKLKQELI